SRSKVIVPPTLTHIVGQVADAEGGNVEPRVAGRQREGDGEGILAGRTAVRGRPVQASRDEIEAGRLAVADLQDPRESSLVPAIAGLAFQMDPAGQPPSGQRQFQLPEVLGIPDTRVPAAEVDEAEPRDAPSD